MGPRAALLLLLVAVTPLVAGCNWSDWYNQRGTVVVMLMPIGPQGTNLSEFQKVEVAILGVSLRQLDTVEPKSYSYNPAIVVDLVKYGTTGQQLELARDKFNLRAISEVTLILTMVPNGTVSASGRVIPDCHPGERSPHPCLSTPTNGAFRFSGDDKPFSVPRGGTATFHFPLAVKWDPTPPADWYLENDPARAIVDKG